MPSTPPAVNCSGSHETDLAAYQVIAQDGFVYFNTDGSIISALDPVSGEEIWRGGIDIENLFLRTVVEGVAFADAGTDLYALDAASGELLWSYTADDRFLGVSAAEGVVYFTTYAKHVYALDAATGQALWRAATESLVNASPGCG